MSQLIQMRVLEELQWDQVTTSFCLVQQDITTMIENLGFHGTNRKKNLFVLQASQASALTASLGNFFLTFVYQRMLKVGMMWNFVGIEMGGLVCHLLEALNTSVALGYECALLNLTWEDTLW